MVSENSPEVWHIAVTTAKCDCDWVALIDYTADGKPGEIKITKHGKPFRVAAVARATTATPNGQGGWATIGHG